MTGDGAKVWFGTVNEDGTFSILARVTSLDATGELIQDEEGPCLTQADVVSIACHIYSLGNDRDSTTGTEVTPAPILAAAINVFDTLRTSGWPTVRLRDWAGYNFRHDVPGSYVPNPDEWYLLQYVFLTTGGATPMVKVKVRTRPTEGS